MHSHDSQLDHHGPTDEQTNGRTDERTDGRMDEASYRDAWTHLKGGLRALRACLCVCAFVRLRQYDN